MAEGFEPLELTTGIQLSDVQPGQGKRLWLFRVPRHITTQRLEGATIKLPHTGNTEGKVLGRLGSNESNKLDGERKETSAGELVFTSMDSAESSTFRPLLTSDDQGWLAAGGPFAGQVNVSVVPPPLPEAPKIADDGTLSMLVEPYRGRPQLTGMRVRSKLVGAGTEYPRRNQSNTKRRPLRHAPDALSKEGAASSVEEGVGQDGTSPETTAQNIDLKAGQMDMRSAPGTPGDSSESKKKHKKKRLAVAATAASGEEGERQVPSTTVKAKKSKKRDRRSM